MKVDFAGAHANIENPEEVLGRARAWSAAHGADVLVADARAIFGRDHLVSAATHAQRSNAREAMAARSVGIEALLYLSGQRQVADAIRVAGIRRGTEAVGVAVFGEPSVSEFLRVLGWSRDDSVLDPLGKTLQVLGFTALEEATVPATRRTDLALECVALVDVRKG